MVTLSIKPELEARWRSVLEREINLSLAPVRGRLRAARVRFVQVALPDGGAPGFRCTVTGRGIGGEVHRAQADSSDGRIAIQSAIVRIRRDVIRRHQIARLPRRA